MSRLFDRLVEQYAAHYERINPEGVDPRSTPAAQLRLYSRTYGHLLKAVPPQGEVLDLGCGTGKFLAWLASQPGIRAAGVDASTSQAKVIASALPQLSVECDDGLSYLRRNPGRFHGIIAMDVLEHVPGDDNLLDWVDAAYAALVPGGFFSVRVPNAANLFASYSRYIDLTHVRAFTTTSMTQLLEVAGFHSCRAFPVRPGTLKGRIAVTVERVVSRLLFAMTGRHGETEFGMNIDMVGYRPA